MLHRGNRGRSSSGGPSDDADHCVARDDTTGGDCGNPIYGFYNVLCDECRIVLSRLPVQRARVCGGTSVVGSVGLLTTSAILTEVCMGLKLCGHAFMDARQNINSASTILTV